MSFKKGYINLDHFNDTVYAKISLRMQHRYNFCKGDKINFSGRFYEKDGRIIVTKLNRIDIEKKAMNETWTESKVHLAKRTGTIIPVQYEKCLNCDKGSLLDIVSDSKKKRALFCLEGIRNPQFCSYNISKLIFADNCAKVDFENR